MRHDPANSDLFVDLMHKLNHHLGVQAYAFSNQFHWTDRNGNECNRRYHDSTTLYSAIIDMLLDDFEVVSLQLLDCNDRLKTLVNDFEDLRQQWLLSLSEHPFHSVPGSLFLELPQDEHAHLQAVIDRLNVQVYFYSPEQLTKLLTKLIEDSYELAMECLSND